MTYMAQEPFLAAELDYRLARARSGFGQHMDTGGSDRRHRVRRRPVLHLPRPRRRPPSLA